MQTVATKPTAKQMLAAKRAAKESTRQERAVKRAGTVKNVDRNRLSARSKAQKENIARMLSGAKVSEDEALTCGIMMRLSLQDMRYACNQELINFAEHIVKQVQRLGLYCNTDDPANEESVLFACREASQAVAQWTKDFDDLSPNQRQLVLRPLSNLFAAYEEFLKDAPARLIAEVSAYSLAVRVAKKAMAFLELDGGLISAVGKVVNGADSRAEARRLAAESRAPPTDKRRAPADDENACCGQRRRVGPGRKRLGRRHPALRQRRRLQLLQLDRTFQTDGKPDQPHAQGSGGMRTHIRTCVYHDSGTKGFKHGIRHKRHGCRRGGTSVFQRGEDGKPQRVSRIRKRSATPGQARERTKTHDVSRTQQP
ncbi:putative phage associated protein [Neisseria gonorrhoeae]|nr:putative phage associated protein [Neisseria gonorrhoeae]